MRQASHVILALGLLVTLSVGCANDDAELGTHWQNEEEDVVETPGVLTLEPEGLQFGYVCTTATAVRTITLSNTGESELTILDVTAANGLESAFSLVTDLTSVTLSPGASLEAQIEYEPTELNTDTDTLTFEHDGAAETTALPLEGQVGGPELQLGAEEIDFGPVAVDDVVIRTAQLKSSGALPLTVLEISMESALPADVLWLDGLSVTTYPTSLEPDSVIEVSLAMRPDAYRPYSTDPLGSLSVRSSDCTVSDSQIPIHGWPGGVDTDCVPLMEEGHVGKEIDDVDVLFVVDDSASMEEEQEHLADHFNSFLSYADGLDIDYRIGVTTTDTGLAAGKLQGPAPIVSPNNSDDFLMNVQVGTKGADSERGIEASLLSVNGADDTRFGGHMRADAHLAVIYVSDDEDHSEVSVASAAAQLIAAKDGGLTAKTHAIVARPPGCVEEVENFGLRYMEMSATTGGAVISICDEVFEEAFSEIGVACFGDAAIFPLERPADPETVEIMVNGELCVGSWTLSPDVSSVIFDVDSPCFPAAGIPVVIRYVPLCWQD